MASNNVGTKYRLLKLKACGKCRSKDIRYIDNSINDRNSDLHVLPTLMYIGCGSCGHSVSKMLDSNIMKHDQSDVDAAKKLLIAKWNLDHDVRINRKTPIGRSK